MRTFLVGEFELLYGGVGLTPLQQRLTPLELSKRNGRIARLRAGEPPIGAFALTLELCRPEESTCVVETGRPYMSAAMIVPAAISSAEAPWP